MDVEDFYGRYVDCVTSYVLRHASIRDAGDIVAETSTVAWRRRGEKLPDSMPTIPQLWPGKSRLAETERCSWWGQRVVMALALV
jgi:hypothetical protein